MNERGWIYCLTNPLLEVLVKIGKTSKCPHERAKELSGTNMPLPYKVEFAKYIHDYERKELQLHKLLEKYIGRKNPNREFFLASPETVKLFFDILEEPQDIVDEYQPSEEELINEFKMMLIRNRKIEKKSTLSILTKPCRNLKMVLIDGQEVRHRIRDLSENGYDTLLGVYKKDRDKIMTSDGNLYTLNGFSESHYASKRPDRTSNNNAWKECECLLGDSWISMFNLPTIN